MLYPGEVGVCSEPMYAWAPPQQIPGTLFLTNLRLVFETASPYHQAYGLDQALGLAPQAPPPMLNLEVRSITNVSAVPAPSGWHTLRVEASGGAYVYNFQTPRANEWLNSIHQVRGHSPLPSGAPPAGMPVAPAAPSPAIATPATPTAGTVWCSRCGKPNPPGANHCMGCGVALATGGA
jgi:hypothetical protein